MEKELKDVAVIGGGLVGTLCAYFFERQGYKVGLYECREDIRTINCVKGRSINLSLSNRGRKALRKVGLEEEVLKSSVPMIGRRLHFIDGKEKSVPYDAFTSQPIYSVGRNFLNKFLLSVLERNSKVSLNFNCKLLDVNFKTGELTFIRTSTGELFRKTPDLVIGADGAYSNLRRNLQQTFLFDYSQKYIDHGYIELTIDASKGKRMEPNHLHIWPRGHFMMIALPNIDGSWTATLFMPFEKFYKLHSEESVLQFFKNNFPDAVHYIGEDKLVQDILNTKPSSLISIKCSKFHYKDKFLIIGDAAHAIVPFYGQGMNAGFEDCIILDNLLEKYADDFAKILVEFSRIRVKDAHALSDLAMYNYIEMRDLVTRSSYHLRKWFDNAMYKMIKEKWQPLYYSVTFTDQGYEVCMEHKRWQSKVITKSLFFTVAILLVFVCILLENIRSSLNF